MFHAGNIQIVLIPLTGWTGRRWTTNRTWHPCNCLHSLLSLLLHACQSQTFTVSKPFLGVSSHLVEGHTSMERKPASSAEKHSIRLVLTLLAAPSILLTHCSFLSDSSLFSLLLIISSLGRVLSRVCIIGSLFVCCFSFNIYFQYLGKCLKYQ